MAYKLRRAIVMLSMRLSVSTLVLMLALAAPRPSAARPGLLIAMKAAAHAFVEPLVAAKDYRAFVKDNPSIGIIEKHRYKKLTFGSLTLRTSRFALRTLGVVKLAMGIIGSDPVALQESAMLLGLSEGVLSFPAASIRRSARTEAVVHATQMKPEALIGFTPARLVLWEKAGVIKGITP